MMVLCRVVSKRKNNLLKFYLNNLIYMGCYFTDATHWADGAELLLSLSCGLVRKAVKLIAETMNPCQTCDLVWNHSERSKNNLIRTVQLNDLLSYYKTNILTDNLCSTCSPDLTATYVYVFVEIYDWKSAGFNNKSKSNHDKLITSGCFFGCGKSSRSPKRFLWQSWLYGQRSVHSLSLASDS